MVGGIRKTRLPWVPNSSNLVSQARKKKATNTAALFLLTTDLKPKSAPLAVLRRFDFGLGFSVLIVGAPRKVRPHPLSASHPQFNFVMRSCRALDSAQAAFVQSMIIIFAGGKTGLSAAVTGKGHPEIRVNEEESTANPPKY